MRRVPARRPYMNKTTDFNNGGESRKVETTTQQRTITAEDFCSLAGIAAIS